MSFSLILLTHTHSVYVPDGQYRGGCYRVDTAQFFGPFLYTYQLRERLHYAASRVFLRMFLIRGLQDRCFLLPLDYQHASSNSSHMMIPIESRDRVWTWLMLLQCNLFYDILLHRAIFFSISLHDEVYCIKGWVKILTIILV